MLSLPIDADLPRITASFRQHDSLVLIAPPGAGKTTRVPPALMGANLLPQDHPHLIMLQPRRVAARAAAQRMADEQSWQLGNQVGYHIRFEKRYAATTRIRILTEAILTRMLLADQSLEGIGCVILDEFHERSIHSDLALAFLREIQQTIRPDLKILVMSATLDPQPISQFLGNCPIIETQGRTFPIEITYRASRDQRLEDQIASVIEEALAHEGDILVFLPGKAEIDRARRTLQFKRETRNAKREIPVILPLHGSLSSEEQQRALAPACPGTCKIILATNIAETSLTIDGVRTVIDSGLARIASFDPGRGMDRLDLARISKASATQRAGRAGRQAPGRAIRLWPELEQKHLPDFTPPEIHRVDLASTLLAVHAWGTRDPRTFPWFDSPEEPMLAAAENLLILLGALDNGQLSDLGRAMLHIPAHPRIARLLLAAKGTSFLEDALTLAALLSDDSRTTRSGSDALVGSPLPAQLTPLRDQFANTLRNTPRSQIGDHQSKIKNPTDLLLLAYPDRLAKRRTGAGDPHAAVLADGTGLRLATEALTPALARCELFLALDAHFDPHNRRSEALVRTALPIDEAALYRLFPEAFHTDNALEYNPASQKVSAFARHYFRELLLHEDSHGKVDPSRAGEVLAAALAPRARELFTQDDRAHKLLARIAFLRHHMPEHAWPALDDQEFRDLLTQAAANKRSLAELTESPALTDALRAALRYPLDRLLDQHAPETLEVPSGSHIKLEYVLSPTPTAPPPPPILAVRLQELFGWLDTPRLAGGRAAVLLHLLSPGFKPMQITSDLKSFWKSAYFEIRKDLRARYPKHKWPEDPLTATPEAKGRRR